MTTTGRRATAAQCDIIRAAAAGALAVNDSGGAYRRTSRTDGRRSNHALTERVRAAGWIEAVRRPGCSSLYEYRPTEAGRGMIGEPSSV